MTTRTFAFVSVSATAVCGLVGWTMIPEEGMRWLLVIVSLPALWSFLEAASRPSAGTEAGDAIRRLHRIVVGVGGLFVLLQIVPQLAAHAELITAETLNAGRRARGLLVGIALVVWGNHLPKVISPWALGDEPFNWQWVHRIVGWLAVGSGLGLVVVWLALPGAQARSVAQWIVISLFVIAITVKFSSVFRYGAAEQMSSGDA